MKRFTRSIIAIGLSANLVAGCKAGSNNPQESNPYYRTIRFQAGDDGFDMKATTVESYYDARIRFRNLQLGVCSIKGAEAHEYKVKNHMEGIIEYSLDKGTEIDITHPDAQPYTIVLTKAMHFENASAFQDNAQLDCK